MPISLIISTAFESIVGYEFVADVIEKRISSEPNEPTAFGDVVPILNIN